MEQSTIEWLKWRNEGIGASDAPIIMGKSPYKTKSELWDEKFNKTIPSEDEEKSKEFIFNKGHKLEAWARPGLEFNTGYSWRPSLFTHNSFEFIRASLDGWQPDLKEVWECKFMGRDIFDVLKDESIPILKRIPTKYYDQLMQQFFVTGAVALRLTGIVETKDEHGHPQKEQYTLKIERNEKINIYINETLAPALFAFWKSVQDGTRPETDDKHVMPLKNKGIKKIILKYEKVKAKEKLLTEKVKAYSEKTLGTIKEDVVKLKTEIYEHPSRDHKKMDVEGFKLTVVTGKELVDYKEAFHSFVTWLQILKFKASDDDILAAIKSFPDKPDMSKYTTAGKESFKITIPKREKNNEVREMHKDISGNAFGKPTFDDVGVFEENIIKAPSENAGTIEIPKGIDLKKGTKVSKNSTGTRKQEWANATPEQQEIIVKGNLFKHPDSGKAPKKWTEKDRNEKIQYLKRTARRKETSEMAKEIMLKLAEELSGLKITKKSTTINGVKFD